MSDLNNLTKQDVAEIDLHSHRDHIASVLDEVLENGLADGWSLSRFSNELYEALTGKPRHECVRFDAHNNEHEYVRCVECKDWQSYSDAFEAVTGKDDWQAHLDNIAPKKHQNYADMSRGW